MCLIQSRSLINTCGLSTHSLYFKYFKFNTLKESNYVQLSKYHVWGISNYFTTSVLIQDESPVLVFSFFVCFRVWFNP